MAKAKARKRMTRKELKKPDAVLSTMEQAVEWMGQHRKAILIGVLVAVAGAALWGVYLWRTGKQTEKAAKLYKKGMRVYTALIDPSLTKDSASKPGEQGQAYRTREARAKAALKIFNRVVNQFEGYPISRAAHLYRGNCFFDLKKYGQAITAYKKVLSTSGKSGCGCGGAGESSDSLKALALENLGYAQTAKGRLADAARTFARLRSVDKGSRRDWAYWHEAVIREAKGDLPGAIKAYEKVRQTGRSSKGQNPDLTFMLSPLNDYSTKRARYLKMKLEEGRRPSAKRPEPKSGFGVRRPIPMGPDPVGAAGMDAAGMDAAGMDAAGMDAAGDPMKPAPTMATMGAMKPAPTMATMAVMKPAPAMAAMKPAPRPAMARP